MIKIIDDLFLTEDARFDLLRIKWEILNPKKNSPYCVITLSKHTDDVFDIIPVSNFKTASEKLEDIIIIGLAEDTDDGIKLCSEMTAMYVEANSNLTLREYFSDIIDNSTIKILQ